MLAEALPHESVFVGTVTRASELAEELKKLSRAATRPRTREAFDALAQEAGWRLESALEAPFTHDVRLRLPLPKVPDYW